MDKHQGSMDKHRGSMYFIFRFSHFLLISSFWGAKIKKMYGLRCKLSKLWDPRRKKRLEKRVLSARVSRKTVLWRPSYAPQCLKTLSGGRKSWIRLFSSYFTFFFLFYIFCLTYIKYAQNMAKTWPMHIIMYIVNKSKLILLIEVN